MTVSSRRVYIQPRTRQRKTSEGAISYARGSTGSSSGGGHKGLFTYYVSQKWEGPDPPLPPLSAKIRNLLTPVKLRSLTCRLPHPTAALVKELQSSTTKPNSSHTTLCPRLREVNLCQTHERSESLARMFLAEEAHGKSPA